MIKKILNKLFYSFAWSTGYRFIDNENELIGKSIYPFNYIMPNERCWYADPFPFYKDSIYYIFVEIFDYKNGRGTIGMSLLINGKASSVKEVLKEEFHLSYPNVFEYNGEIYMIPETKEAKQIRLYKSKEFPFKWNLDKVLLDNIEVVDSSFLITNNKLFIINYDISKDPFFTRTFVLNMNTKTLQELHLDKSNYTNDRPGGNFININGIKYHPVQDSTHFYGEQLNIFEVEIFNETLFLEKNINCINVNKMLPNGKHCFSRIHTFNRLDKFETIDLLYNKFYITKPLRKFKNIFIKMKKDFNKNIFQLTIFLKKR